MRKLYTKEVYKKGKHKGWLKNITFYMPPRKGQQGVSTTFPISTKFGFVDLVVPNIIGIEKVSIIFNYSEKYLHPYK